MIKYIGSKRKLLPQIEAAIRSCVEPSDTCTPTVVDMFSGAGHVSRHLRSCGYKVTANDMNLYATVVAQTYLTRPPSNGVIQSSLEALNNLPGQRGYFTRTFCEDAMFFQPKNGMRVDAIRESVRGAGYPVLYTYLLTSLMEAADRVDNTTGVQMAYLKKWCKRSYNDLELRPLDIPEGPEGSAVCLRAEQFFAIRPDRVDVAYLDPPYNQHNYRGNYHIWETLCRWDFPETYGKANKRVDIKSADTKSDFNSKPKAVTAMKNLVDSINARFIVVSFNDEGFIDRPTMVKILSARGNVSVQAHDYKRYIGSQIGIHDLQGNKVGKAGASHNKELIYICEVTQ